MRGLKQRLEPIVLRRMGLNWRTFAGIAGVKYPTLMALLKRDSTPRSDTLQSIARAAGVSPEWLLTGKEDPHPLVVAELSAPYGLTDDERELIDLWRSLPPEARQRLLLALCRELRGTGPPDHHGAKGEGQHRNTGS